MAKRISASNAVVQAVEYAAAIYGVRCYRMQTGQKQVMSGGKERPMFMGAWRDQVGTLHYGGMADLLLTPRIRTGVYEPGVPAGQTPVLYRPCVALWVECKSGSGRLSAEQKNFRDDVIDAGAYWLEARDSAEVVIEWFKQNGVKR